MERVGIGINSKVKEWNKYAET